MLDSNFPFSDLGLDGSNSSVPPANSDEGSSIMKILDLFSRPRRAVVSTAMGEGPVSGLKGEKEYSWGDYFGMPKGTPDQDWGPWLYNEIPRFGLDAVLDPLNLVGGKIPEALGYGAKGLTKISPGLARWYAGSGLGARFMRTLPEGIGPYDKFEGDVAALRRLGNPMEAQQAALEAHNAITDQLKVLNQAREAQGMDPLSGLDIFQAIERGTDNPELQQLTQAVQPLRDIREKRFEDLINLQRDVGVPEEALPKKIDEPGFGFMPHEGLNPNEASGSFSGRSLNPNAYDTDARQIMRWETPEGELLSIGKRSDTRTGIKEVRNPLDPVTGEVIPGSKFYYQGQEVIPKQASLMDKVKGVGDIGPVVPEGTFTTDPVYALYKDFADVNSKANYLQMVRDQVQSGTLTREAVPGFREVSVPGVEGTFYADPGIANRMNTIARGAFGKAIPQPWDVELMDKALGTKAGQLFQEGTNWFKRNVLALHPGWAVGDAASHGALQYQSGMDPATQVVRRIQAANLDRGAGSDILEGLSNAELRNEAAVRDLLHNNQYSVAERDYLSSGAEPGNTGQRILGALDAIPGVTPENRIAKGIADAGQWIADKWGKANDMGLKVGGYPETNARLGSFIDFIKKNYPTWATMAPEEKAAAMDKAARYAKESLVDFSMENMPQWEKNMRQLIPFYNWQRGILGRTGEIAINDPQKLARTDLILKELFQPYSNEELATADPWIREGAPTKGLRLPGTGTYDAIAQALGAEPLDQGSRMARIGRMMPQDAVEALYQRPADAILSWINPLLKIPAELIANRDTFKDRPVDKIAGSFPESLINPMLGRPYEGAGQQTFGAELPAAWQHIIQGSPAGRYLNEINTLGSGALWQQDPYRQPMGPGEKAAWYLTGGRYFPWDETKFMSNRMREYDQRMKDLKSDIKYSSKKGADDAMQRYLEYMMEMSAKSPLEH